LTLPGITQQVAILFIQSSVKPRPDVALWPMPRTDATWQRGAIFKKENELRNFYTLVNQCNIAIENGNL